MSESIESAIRFLESLHRFDLARLISKSAIELDRTHNSRQRWGSAITLHSPRPFSDALKTLPEHDRNRIGEAIVADDPSWSASNDVSFAATEGPPIEGPQTLLPELVIHREMLISVGTGGDRIQDVNDYYIARQSRIETFCAAAGIELEVKFKDLWEWYRFYSASLGGYQPRRQYIASLFKKPVEAASVRVGQAPEPRPPTGWERVDRALAKAHAQISTATAEEDFQAIGLLCREVIISLAQAVYDPTIHETIDGVTPSPTDANRMLEAYIAHVFPGESYKEVRAHARASLALALNLQHRRTATQQLAALCVEAASSVTAVISIISTR